MSKSKKKQDAVAAFPRLSWTRSPVQRAHSTPKGERGYCRRKAKRELRRMLAD